VTDLIFVDSDVILDLVARREPFYPAAAELFSRAENRRLTLCTSSLIFANLFYILRKQTSSATAVTALQKLRLLVTVLPVNEKIIDLALASAFTYFEDAIQYYTAVEQGVAVLITRNIRDYRKPAITVCTPQEFLKSLSRL
jgi:predicted nucleic acid-binding protein